MSPWRLCRLFFTAGCLGLSLLSPAALRIAHAQSTAAVDGPLESTTDVSRAPLLTNDAVIRMTKAGLGDDLLLQTIRTQPGKYNTGPDDLIALKTAGVSDVVISAMEAHGTGLAVRNRPPEPRRVDPSPLAPGVDEIGVYYKDAGGGWVPLQTELVEFRSGGWAKSTFTHNIVKQDQNGYLHEARSPLALKTGVEILIYAPAGTQPQEYDFLRFREHSAAREFRVRTGGVFHSETGSQRDEIEFHPQKIAPQMYEFTVPKDIEKGEYGVLPPGSSNQRGIANAGKIFTFSIRD